MKKPGIVMNGLILLIGLLFAGTAVAGEQAGSVIAVRGNAFIERAQQKSQARVRDAVTVNDTISTARASRIKVLFSDESVLTLGEESRVVVREFLRGTEKGGSSIFNLIDGKLRSVVGKNAFEVHTPTAVAAARGTVILFETGLRNGKKFTLMICVEGKFLARSSDPRFTGEQPVAAGMAITGSEGEPLSPAAPASREDIERLLRETDMGGSEISIPRPPGGIVGPWGPLAGPLGGFRPDLGLSGSQQPVSSTTPVQIDVIFPQGR